MTYKGDPLAEKLDRIAGATGIPTLQRKLNARDPVRLRVLPALFVALAVVGMAVEIRWGGLGGFWIVWAAWMGSFACQSFGPLRPQPARQRDEREAALVRQGHFVGMMWALGIAVLGSLTIAIGSAGEALHLWPRWMPESPMEWMTITLFLLAIEANLAVLAASAATPDPLEDDE